MAWADLLRWLTMAALVLQVALLVGTTFEHRKRRHQPHFSRVWIHAYALTASYTALAIATIEIRWEHLGEPATVGLWLTAVASLMGLVGSSVAAGMFYIARHRDAVRGEVSSHNG